MTPAFTIGTHPIGLDHPTYVIADIAANHDGDLNRALRLIELAAEAGADATKFQNFAAPTIVSDRGFADLGGQMSHQATWDKSVVEVYAEASIPLDWTPALRDRCKEVGVDYFTAPYDLGLIEQLVDDVAAWKVGSGDITWLDAIEAMAATGKPILIATGASELEEVRRAVAAAEKHTGDIVVMQCNTNYTASIENLRYVALNVLKTYSVEFPNAVLGLSDHTPGHATALGAVALGARVIEKHLTDDQNRTGPDHRFSMTPDEWRDMVDRVRELESALGTDEKHVMENEKETKVVQRRAVRAAVDLPQGTVLQRDHLEVLRPCPDDGLPPYELPNLVGRRLVHARDRGEHLRASDVE